MTMGDGVENPEDCIHACQTRIQYLQSVEVQLLRRVQLLLQHTAPLPMSDLDGDDNYAYTAGLPPACLCNPRTRGHTLQGHDSTSKRCTAKAYATEREDEEEANADFIQLPAHGVSREARALYAGVCATARCNAQSMYAVHGNLSTDDKLLSVKNDDDDNAIVVGVAKHISYACHGGAGSCKDKRQQQHSTDRTVLPSQADDRVEHQNSNSIHTVATTTTTRVGKRKETGDEILDMCNDSSFHTNGDNVRSIRHGPDVIGLDSHHASCAALVPLSPSSTNLSSFHSCSLSRATRSTQMLHNAHSEQTAQRSVRVSDDATEAESKALFDDSSALSTSHLFRRPPRWHGRAQTRYTWTMTMAHTNSNTTRTGDESSNSTRADTNATTNVTKDHYDIRSATNTHSNSSNHLSKSLWHASSLSASSVSAVPLDTKHEANGNAQSALDILSCIQPLHSDRVTYAEAKGSDKSGKASTATAPYRTDRLGKKRWHDDRASTGANEPCDVAVQSYVRTRQQRENDYRRMHRPDEYDASAPMYNTIDDAKAKDDMPCDAWIHTPPSPPVMHTPPQYWAIDFPALHCNYPSE